MSQPAAPEKYASRRNQAEAPIRSGSLRLGTSRDPIARSNSIYNSELKGMMKGFNGFFDVVLVDWPSYMNDAGWIAPTASAERVVEL